MFKRAKVVMLPTNEKALIHFGTPKNNLRYTRLYKDSIHHKYQHLYITSDDEIKEGDWCYDKVHQYIVRISKELLGNYLYKKIIATTDSSLEVIVAEGPFATISKTLPQPSQSFIEVFVRKYNKGNIITDVLVEYEEIKTWCNDGKVCVCNNPKFCNENRNRLKHILKVNPKDNTITIKKVKDSWSREEVEEFRTLADAIILSASDVLGKNYDEEYNNYFKWIEENL